MLVLQEQILSLGILEQLVVAESWLASSVFWVLEVVGILPRLALRVPLALGHIEALASSLELVAFEQLALEQLGLEQQ